ncbi:MAG: sortase [Ardenticatenaceae bacterium]|nr:sortase [Ardenticatenaceae bacterium]MCB9446078.1 sortase [Ardenticatenaceae bacterium]
MSGQNAHGAEQKIIPLGVVLVVVGLILLVTVLAIWIVAPVYMPQSLYDLVGDYLPKTAVSNPLAFLPTPAAVAAVPEPILLLPETPSEEEAEAEVLPSYFVSVAEAAQREPGAGEPVRLVIPTIDLDAPVGVVSMEKITDGDQTYYQWPVPNEFMAGWHDNSARLGEVGNTVLNGHHNIYGEVFRDLIDLEEGDEIILYDQDRSYSYEVTDKEILAERGQPMEVRIENAQWIAPTDDERITLITCWPYTDNSHRLVVVAKRVQDSG